jgi:acetyl-CoA carboxylase carboxyltransferase component
MPQEDPRILELRALREQARQGGGEERIARQHAKGKLTARERLNLLLDPGTFNELEPFITHQGDEMGLATEKYMGEGVVTGYGQIDGRTVYVYAQDFTIYGGTLSEMQSHKICRVMDLALRNGAPIIGLIDSGGARIQEGVKSLGGYAEIFRRNALYSGVIPQISVMLGPCAGGAAYSPALTDLIIMVRKHAFMFLTGPQVIKTVTGEDVDHDQLGGADVHTSISGLAHLAANTEREALAYCRQVLSYLPSNNVENPPYVTPTDDPLRMDQELNSIVPLDPAEPYSMHEVINHVVDRGTFFELHAAWAQNAIIGLARIGGHSVGIIAQEPSIMAGVIDIDAADKITRFVRMCDCCGLARLFARRGAGASRHHPAWRKGAVCLFGGHRAQDQRDHAQSLRRRLRGYEQQIPGYRRQLRLAERRDRRHGGRGRGEHPVWQADRHGCRSG